MNQKGQYQLWLYHSFAAAIPATCADCGKKCDSIDYAMFTRPNGQHCSAYLCSSCPDKYRNETRD